MTALDFDLARLLAPTPPAAFLREHWGKRPLVVPGRGSDHYAGLFSTGVLDHLISTFGAGRSADIRTVKDDQVTGLSRYLRADGALDLDALRSAHARGSTIVFYQCDLHPPLVSLFRELERVFHHPVTATAFQSPADARAFGAHFDDVDTFVLQIEGAKDWRVYGALPAEGESPLGALVAGDRLPPLLHEVRLEAGDFLYIPRRFVHEASTSGSPSLSLSMYFRRYTWADLLRSTVTALSQEHACLREPLPWSFLDEEARPALLSRFESVLRPLLGSASAGAAIDQLAERFLLEGPPPDDGHAPDPEEIARIEADTLLRRRRGVMARVAEEPGGVTIQFSGGAVTGPPKIEAALRFLAAVTEFTPAALPGPLAPAEKLVLARRLVREGLLTVVR
jgi:hypothetical protein